MSLRQATELNPGFAVAHYNLGSVLQRANRVDEAADSLRRAIAAKPDVSDAVQARDSHHLAPPRDRTTTRMRAARRSAKVAARLSASLAASGTSGIAASPRRSDSC